MFNDRLKELRNEKHLSQQNIADMLGMKLQSYQKYEYGQREPGMQMLIKLADCFDVSVDYLLGRTDNKK